MAEELAAKGQGIRLEGQDRWPELWCEAARHQAPRVAKAKPARTTRIPHHHTRFNISTVKTSD